MKNRTYGFMVVCGLQVATTPCFAIQKHHHPWFSHHHDEVTTTDVIASPSVLAKQSVDENNDRSPHSPDNRRARDDGQQVAQQALKYEGTRYKFGGTNKRGMDCSGLVARVWSDLKLKKIPRVSSALYNSGQPVHLAELRPGDLVFFKNTYKHGISHVGVYAGDNKFIHAANHSKGVTITKLSDPYYQLHYAGARRLY